MFSPDLRRRYEQDERLADSGSRPVLDTFIDADHRDVRFMPRNTPSSEYGRFASFTRGVRQVHRRQGGLEPAF